MGHHHHHDHHHHHHPLTACVQHRSVDGAHTVAYTARCALTGWREGGQAGRQAGEWAAAAAAAAAGAGAAGAGRVKGWPVSPL